MKSKKLKVAFGVNCKWASTDVDKTKDHNVITKSLHDKQRNKWNYKLQKNDSEEDKSFELNKIYIGKLKLVKTYYQSDVMAILPDLFGENCLFSISKETIFDALEHGLLCEDGSFYGPFEFYIGSGNKIVSIITPRK